MFELIASVTLMFVPLNGTCEDVQGYRLWERTETGDVYIAPLFDQYTIEDVDPGKCYAIDTVTNIEGEGWDFCNEEEGELYPACRIWLCLDANGEILRDAGGNLAFPW